jgi:hypothetical protein
VITATRAAYLFLVLQRASWGQPAINQAGVVNGASSPGGAVAPDEIITIYGQNLGPASLVHFQDGPDGSSIPTAFAGTRGSI